MPRATAEKAFYFRVKVRGRTAFPVDMLRYDRCFPASETDSYKINGAIHHDPAHRDPDGKTTVELVMVGREAMRMPTDGRWRSFGWEVVDYAPVS